MTLSKPEITLKALRTLRQLTQKELAIKTNRHPSTIIKYEKGETSPSIDDYLLIKEILDPQDEFFLRVKSS